MRAQTNYEDRVKTENRPMSSYNAEYSSVNEWPRTIDSMLLEWDAHNIFAPFDNSAQDTDFDKNEEGKGYSYFFGKAAERGYNKYIAPLWE